MTGVLCQVVHHLNPSAVPLTRAPPPSTGISEGWAVSQLEPVPALMLAIIKGEALGLHSMPSHWDDWEVRENEAKTLACLSFSSSEPWHPPCFPPPHPFSFSLFHPKDTHASPKYHFRAGFQSLPLSEIHCALAIWHSLQTAQWVFL